MSKQKASKVEGQPNTPSQTDQVRQILDDNPGGLTAGQIAIHLGTVSDASTKQEKSKAEKKVRVLARKVTGGTARSKDGRHAVYQLGSHSVSAA